MATMVKDKRKEKKKKTKEKYSPNLELEQPPSVNFVEILETGSSPLTNKSEILKPVERLSEAPSVVERLNASEKSPSAYINTRNNNASEESSVENNIILNTPQDVNTDIVVTSTTLTASGLKSSSTVNLELENTLLSAESVGNTYGDLNSQLRRMFMPVHQEPLSSASIERLHTPEAYLKPVCDENVKLDVSLDLCVTAEEIVPSAPVIDTEESQRVHHMEQVMQVVKNKLPCMPIEEAIGLYGGKEMEEVRVLSEREEVFVEAGAVSGPEHPLVDLLSTFRSSLAAVERARTQLAHSFIEEEKYRTALWKIEKRYSNQSEICKCGASVDLNVTYEHAELRREKLPVARMKLEAILKDVQESYCHHQHAALLAHCQIEELIAETIESNKNEIREALTLILQALRLSEGSQTALASALQRWAQALAEALLDGRDIRQLLFFIHHLFRQTRSVRWAARLIHLQVGDSCEAAQMIALFDLLICRPRLESAVECTEDCDEVWEEVDRHGTGGAVSEGALRERDLLELMHTFPLRDLVARIVLVTRSDVTDISESSWGDRAGGRGVIKAACGIRALLVTCARARATHSTYPQLRDALHELVAGALHALAGLHLHSRNFYSEDLEERIMAELEACFSLGFTITDVDKLYKLPTTLLCDDTANDYCVSFITSLHDKSSKRMQLLDVETPLCTCSVRARIVAQATLDRTTDHELAAIVLEFLIHTGVKRKTSPCKGSCDATAREYLPRLLHTHPYFYASALHILAEINQGDTLEPSSVEPLAVHQWRPTCMEIRATLADWSCRCPQLLQHLLLQLDYTPHTGISLECQLCIGAWLCQYLQELTSEPPQWTWNVLRRLHLHRTSWNMPLDAPPPDEPKDLFSTAYALLSSSWGHCIPLICEYGVTALCRVATARPRDATFCLAPIMLVMAHSPESISLTPKFTELFNVLLGSGPTLIQRALGRGGESGFALLLRLILAQLEHDRYSGISCSALISVWLYALWRSTLPAVSLSLLDTALLASGDYSQLDRHAALLLQEQNSKDHLDHVVRNAHLAPLLCESVLRIRHTAFELNTQLNARLNDVVTRQRAQGQKIHVNNALKQIGANLSSEELVLYRTATAILLAPLTHPSHLALWRLFFHLYLQRPPYGSQESSLAVGPLFFSGLIKTRTLAQLKKRLQETATYHQNEIEKLKGTKNIEQSLQSTSNRVVKSSSIVIDDNLLPTLSIVDLTGHSSESSDSDSDNEAEVTRDNRREGSRDSESSDSYYRELMQYHVMAEKMVRVYYQWLEEGERVRALPVHAQSLPEQLLDVACRHAVSQSRTTPSRDDPPQTRISPLPVHTPLEKTVATLMMLSNGLRRRSHKVVIQSSVEDVNFKDVRCLLDRVDKHLKNIERLANDWSSEASRVTSLNVQLFDLVSELRVGRPLVPIKKQCPNNCKPITFVVQATEWCISTGAEKGIKENRRSAYVALRRLARARPHAAVTAAALNTIARRIQTGEVGTKVLDRAWRTAGVAANCAPAHLAITALTTDLAERWVCADGRLSASLISRWCSGGSAQRALIGSLVSPRRVPAADWPPLYMALLRAADALPSHNVFSYLSKFELNRWSAVASPPQRREMLEALTVAACRWGCNPDSQHHVLLELIGVHTTTLTNAQELCALVTSCARASFAATLPPTHWRHVVQAADMHATGVTFDQLGNLLRELGVISWEVRTMSTNKKCNARYVAYTPHIAALLHTLQRAFVAAAVQLSYDPDRVSLYAWSSLCESWGPWISPHPTAPPLVPCTGEGEEYAAMLRHFVDSVHQVMIDCPGSENHLLQQTFEWMIQTYVSAGSSRSHESRVQLSSLLAELTKLPWGEHQWMHARCTQHILQICTSVDEEITTWVSHALRSVTSESWLHGIEPVHVPAHLATLLYLLTTMPLQLQTLEEATRLPWWLLSEVVLEQALERFFADHHNPTQPYYSLPQFRIVLFASGLILHPSAAAQAVASASARYKRTCAVSLCVRAACSPALHTHVRAHTDTMLNIIQTLASIPEVPDDEIEELLSRAVVVLCMESAAATALPVWEQWVRTVTHRACVACVRAARALIVLDHYASLADAAAKAHLQHSNTSGWPVIRDSWHDSPWSEASALISRGKLHAAYGTVLARAHSPSDLRATFQALLTANINFVEDEVIVAVWICHTCRVACTQRVGGSEIEDCGAIARALLAQWAEEPRLAILRVITMQSAAGTPTARHRLLCRFAQCVLNPHSESAARAYETCCSTVLGSNTDLVTWAKAPNPKRLSRLAVRLYPNFERYFMEELHMAPDES